ncbi:hypothetical protein ABLE91_26760 [Aquabacter sp. CN5-332]|uniref:PGN_0703 family putative restriction endonuclease n=1 Tax=Aquabacter sp. CN5-332 TaxID=3156608 RepID=UPI0032B387A3
MTAPAKIKVRTRANLAVSDTVAAETAGGAERMLEGGAALFDPAGLGEIPIIPLLPTEILERHHAFVVSDTRFRSAARLLQALWREDHDLAIGYDTDAEGETRCLGSLIGRAAGRAGGNFLSPSISRLVTRELAYRETGAVFDDDRLRMNLLSSQPLVFNLFGPLKLDKGLATTVFASLLPGFIAEVVDIRFEHSPARGHSSFTADGTAFDLLIKGTTAAGKRAFIAIEVKYTESCFEPLPRFSGRFDAIAPASGLFNDPEAPDLIANPIQQLFRQACLASTMLDQELYDVGLHLLIAPRHNHNAQAAGSAFAQQLKDPAAGRIPFVSLDLETVIAAIATAGASDHALALHRRYTDWWLLDGELELADADAS